MILDKSSKAKGKRPHIIIFNPDQMRADSMGHLGNQAAHTPFLDQLVQKDAVSFRRAFCQNPVCVPSRCSFTTGLYPHVYGHRTMSYLLRPGEPSLFSELKSAGYYVWMNSRNDLLAGQYNGLAQRHATEIFYGGESPPPSNPIENKWKNPETAGYYSMYSGRLAAGHYGCDDEDVDAAIHRIRNRVDERPLCVFLGLMNPHPPYMVEEPYFSAINRAKLPPRILPPLRGKSKMEVLLQTGQRLQNWPENDWAELRACYLGMCMKVDALFAKLCAALKEEGIYDDSAIFFLSDHGDYTGDYGIVEKSQNTFEDCLVNVPLLLKPPKSVPVHVGVTNSLVELVDFYATVMDFADVEPCHTNFGHSLRPVLENPSFEVRHFVCCEGGRLAGETQAEEIKTLSGVTETDLYWPRLNAQTDSIAHGKATMLRTKTCKYVARLSEQDEFYDLLEDPDERENRIENPTYAMQITRCKELLLRWYQRTCDVVPFEIDARATPEMVWAKVRAHVPVGQEEETREMIRQGANQDEIIRYYEGGRYAKG